MTHNFEIGEPGPVVLAVDNVVGCDDVNGDGSVIVDYVTVVKVVCNPDGSIARNEFGVFTDQTLTTPYVPTNPGACGQATFGAVPKTIDVTGAITGWTPPVILYAVGLSVLVKEGNPTIIDADGHTRVMDTGESVSWSSDVGLFDLPTFNLGTGDRITVLWAEPNLV